MWRSKIDFGEEWPMPAEVAMSEKDNVNLHKELIYLKGPGSKLGVAFELAGHYCREGDYRRAREVLWPLREDIDRFLWHSPHGPGPREMEQ